MIRILDLPVEMLEAIAYHVPDLTIFRLVCRAFDTAALEPFACEYLSDLQCYILDSQRVQRLRTIISHDQLARRIKNVTLTYDFMEGKSHYDLSTSVMQPNVYIEDSCWANAQGDLLTKMQDENEEKLKDCPPDLNLITSTLQLLNANHKATICFHLNDFLDFDLKSGIWNAIVASGPILTDLVLCEINFLGAREVVDTGEHLHALRRSSRLLKRLTILADNERKLNSTPTLGSPLWTLVEMIYAAKDLEALHVASPNVRPDNSLAFSKAILSANMFSNLQNLQLENAVCHSADLLAVLERCSETLRKLCFWSVVLAPPRNYWKPVLRLLHRSLSRLEDLHLYCLSEGTRTNHILFEHQRWFFTGKRTQLILKGRAQVEEGLSLNIVAAKLAWI